jgi:hypothetical protein
MFLLRHVLICIDWGFVVVEVCFEAFSEIELLHYDLNSLSAKAGVSSQSPNMYVH